MNFKRIVLLFALICGFVSVFAQTEPIVSEEVIFEENGGVVAVEAEYFYKQTKKEVRQWFLFSKGEWPKPGKDHDDPHCKNASNNAYVEILPDTRVTHADKLTAGVNFAGEAGTVGVIHYKVKFNTPGKYYVWVRAFSTGSEDNGIHVGIDGEWPESGQRMQWCEGKKTWRWESKQRTEKNHCGEAYKLFIDVKKAGVHDIAFSMREDGFEFDKFIMTTEKEFVPSGMGPEVMLDEGKLPAAYPEVTLDLATKRSRINAIKHDVPGAKLFRESNFSTNNFYVDKNWLAINPNQDKTATALATFKTWEKGSIKYDVVLLGVGENDGQSEYSVSINNQPTGSFKAPLSTKTYDEASNYCKVWENVSIKSGDVIKVNAKIGSKDGKEYSRARWSGIVLVPAGTGNLVLASNDRNLKLEGEAIYDEVKVKKVTTKVSGELKTWHKVTLTFDGPATSEEDDYNPFMNYKFDVTFSHAKTGKEYTLPGYFAADGKAGNSSAVKGNKWRVHFAPDEVGEWTYKVNFRKGNYVAVSDKKLTGVSGGFMDNANGAFTIKPTDKTGRDFRGKGMLQYVGERYLKFAGTGEYFLKVGSDAPENMLAYEEFDGTFHNDGYGDHMVKTWEAHEKHWNEGDPTWKDGKGKDIIGAVNYLASKGMNAFSFLTNNIKGDDKNVFPYIDYTTYDRIDCSKMDQWEVVFSHADKLGMFLHFKLSEVENQGLLDNGGVGANTKLYYRELIARFGHHLALNWNVGEENGDWVKNNITPPQFTWQRWSMCGYFADHDPYKHHIVIHNGNPFNDMLGPDCPLTGPSVQTGRADFSSVHNAVKRWINESKNAGKQWAVACDEPGDATHSLVPDVDDPEHNNARKNGLWGTFLAGGWGTEWYFGYKHAHSDLTCQDYASRDLFWDQGKIALDFFSDNEIPYWEMECLDELIHTKNDYCLAKPGEIYVFLLKNGAATVDLSALEGKAQVMWYNTRTGGALQKGSKKLVKGGAEVELGKNPDKDDKDWVVLIRK